jgi:hypothetical protein
MALSGAGDGSGVTCISEGPIRDSDWSLTKGNLAFLDSISGGVTDVAPTTSGYRVQPIGRVTGTTKISLNIDDVHGWYIIP